MSGELSGRTALVTGASAGLGVDFARSLARRGADLILVARREQRLVELAAELEKEYGVATEVIAKDLATPDAAAELYGEIKSRGEKVDILINNAGFGIAGPFMDGNLEGYEAMMNLNMLTPVHLTRLVAEEMVERGWGRMIQVASIGAYQASPNYGAYAATKSFILNWGEATDFELRPHGVSCTVVSPGVTETEFFESSGQNQRTWFQKMVMMDSPTVAEIGIKAMLKQRVSIVTGFTNAFNCWMTRFLPRRLVRWVAYLTMKDVV
jgi:uncharacterized protein